MNIIVTGDKALDRKLAELTPKLQKTGIRKGTRDAAKYILQFARMLAPIETGELKQSLRVRTAKGRGGTRLRRGTQGHAVAQPITHFYGRFLEFGTAERQTQSGANRGRIEPVEFLREALYTNWRGAMQIFRRRLAEAIRQV